MPPGCDIGGFWTQIRSGMISLRWKLSKEGRKRFFDEFLPVLHDTKKNVLQEHNDDSWYLVYLGTKEASRRQGLAKRLIEDVTHKVRDFFRFIRCIITGMQEGPFELPFWANPHRPLICQGSSLRLAQPWCQASSKSSSEEVTYGGVSSFVCHILHASALAKHR